MKERISVCMAVYNGADHLQLQIHSILSQLQATDELVVVDDFSQDNSIDILHGFSDARVRVYRNDSNMGVFLSFEKGMRLAHGDIIFLSDQDDVWLPDKVAKIQEAFSRNPKVTLVASDAQIIDGNGCLLSDSFFATRGRFMPGVMHNLIKNKYLGCTLAFRNSMLKYFLPIPKNVPMHDMWFGLLNGIYGNTFYIDQPLIAYRRHGGNLSPLSGASASILQKLVWRWHLVGNLILRVLQCSIVTHLRS